MALKQACWSGLLALGPLGTKTVASWRTPRRLGRWPMASSIRRNRTQSPCGPTTASRNGTFRAAT